MNWLDILIEIYNYVELHWVISLVILYVIYEIYRLLERKTENIINDSNGKGGD